MQKAMLRLADCFWAIVALAESILKVLGKRRFDIMRSLGTEQASGSKNLKTHLTKTMNNDPVWWGSEHDFAFDHVKATIRQHWQQMRRAGVPIKSSKLQSSSAKVFASQAATTFAEAETAIRFGYGARLEYDASFPEWNDDLEFKLSKEWLTMNPTPLATWEQAREAVRYGWTFEDENARKDSWSLRGEEMSIAHLRKPGHLDWPPFRVRLEEAL